MSGLACVQHIKRLRGGSQSQLFRASDGGYYVVKFSNNPQHPRVLANEYLALRLARLVGLPVPDVAPIALGDWLIANTPDLLMQIGGERYAPPAGLHLAVKWTPDAFDYLPEQHMDRLRACDRRAFAGVLAFDKWTCQTDGRQAVFTRRRARYAVSFIDFGYAFNCGEWSFPDSPLRGVYAWNAVYSTVRDWSDFEPWLPAIEALSMGDVRGAAFGLPPEWCAGDLAALEPLLVELHQRRGRVRSLISQFASSTRRPFPEWRTSSPAIPTAASVAAEMRA